MAFLCPTASADLSGKILVVPIVSTANVAQLAADLLIATLSLRQIAILDPTYCIPVVGGREDGLQGITTPLELFGAPGSQIVVVQQRSPILVSRKQEFVNNFLDFIQSSQFSAVLLLSGMNLSSRTDSQMRTSTYQIQLPRLVPLLKGTTLESLGQLPIPHYKSPGPPDEAPVPFIPGGGLTRRILNSIPQHWEVATGSLLQFVLEGDNAADGAMFAAVTAKILGLKISTEQWKQPSSWKAGLFGSPHDQTLYG